MMKENSNESPAKKINTEQPAPTPLRILVVDDNNASARVMGWAVEIMGHEVRIAADGADALASALDNRPDAILMDISLPGGLNGYELCRIMKSEHGFNDTLFIAQTGWNDEEHRRLSREAGFSHHLVKPVDMVRLEKILRDHAATLISTQINL